MSRSQKKTNCAWDFGLASLENRIMFAVTPVALSVSEVAWNGGLQLRINGTTKNDLITLSCTVDGLVIGNTGGWSYTATGTYKNIKIDAGAGNDKMTVDASV